MESYLDLFVPILREMKIDFITFGKPMMFDSGNIGRMVESLALGSTVDDLKSILKRPERLRFIPWKDDGTKLV